MSPLLPSALLLALTCLAAPSRAAEITTIAGNGKPTTAGDSGPATAASLHDPFGITRGPDGLLYVCEFNGHAVRRIAADGTISTIAGTGKPGFSGDGGPATAAQLNKPHEIRFGPDGALYISDMSTHTIRRVDMSTGTISTFAGTGKPGFSGDGGPASSAALHDPIAIEFSPDGHSLLLCDIGNQRVRSIDLNSRIITTLCGNGAKAPTPDGAPLSPATPLHGPRTITFDPKGNLWLALRDGHTIFRASLSDRILHRVAGTGKPGFSGNDGPASAASLSGPKGLASDSRGRIYIADTESHSIRVIDPASGLISVIAGTGSKGHASSPNPLETQLARPHGVFIDKDGSLYIGDSENHVVRRVTGLN
jgi:DNA-binding beta-propeller fold protein YncE